MNIIMKHAPFYNRHDVVTCTSLHHQYQIARLHAWTNMWPDLTKAGFHLHNGKADFTTTQFLHQWTNNPCAYHCQWFPGLLFLGLVSQTCLTCSSARVVFKWQWCDWKGSHLAGNRHTTGQKAQPSNWLLFVISRAWMGLRWGLVAVSTSKCGKTCHFCGSPPPPTSNLTWSFVIVVKNYLECQVIQLAVSCRVVQLKDIA